VSGETHRDEDAALRERRQLEDRLDRQARRIRRANADRRTLIAQSVYLGSIGILFAVPIVAGAYFGRWLDERLQGYSVHWTLSMILLGVLVGAVNVYLFIRE
jgi:ATP synthase protein I